MVTKLTARSATVFGAVADPIRRGILDTLRRGELPAGELARHFPVSRPAVSRHLRILKDAGLIRETRASQSRIYALDPAPLAEVDRWLANYRLFWASRLTDLKQYVEAQEPAATANQTKENEEER
jgi:DNA-binding transcriptional ArsR family regulator